MIQPTVGRIVWFRENPGDKPNAAMICHVFVENERMVNLCVFNKFGFPESRTSVPLVQEGEQPPIGCYCEWMPYQKGQAQKTEALEAQLGAKA